MRYEELELWGLVPCALGLKSPEPRAPGPWGLEPPGAWGWALGVGVGGYLVAHLDGRTIKIWL
jgi:hypothetical protein